MGGKATVDKHLFQLESIDCKYSKKLRTLHMKFTLFLLVSLASSYLCAGSLTTNTYLAQVGGNNQSLYKAQSTLVISTPTFKEKLARNRSQHFLMHSPLQNNASIGYIFSKEGSDMHIALLDFTGNGGFSSRWLEKENASSIPQKDRPSDRNYYTTEVIALPNDAPDISEATQVLIRHRGKVITAP